MSPDSRETNPDEGTYVRGVRIGDMDGRPILRIILIAVLLAVLAITIALTVSATRENSRTATLRHRGMPVQVTVTGCQGISSGIGMGVEYWECRGTYSLAGRSYNEVIGGSRAHLQTGQMVTAVAVPGQPGLLSAAVGTQSGWKPYLAPIILGGLLVASIVALLWWSRHRRDNDTPLTTRMEPAPIDRPFD